MIFGIDFDGTLVDDKRRRFADTTTPLRLMPGARDALVALKHAGHKIIVISGRANRALREDPMLDPLVRAGARRVDRKEWEKARPIHEARYRQMLEFIEREVGHLVDAVDDGTQGKPIVDVWIDDKALRFGGGTDGYTWADVRDMFGHRETKA